MKSTEKSVQQCWRQNNAKNTQFSHTGQSWRKRCDVTSRGHRHRDYFMQSRWR